MAGKRCVDLTYQKGDKIQVTRERDLFDELIDARDYCGPFVEKE